MILWSEHGSCLSPRSNACIGDEDVYFIDCAFGSYLLTHTHTHATSASSLIKILLKIGWSSNAFMKSFIFTYKFIRIVLPPVTHPSCPSEYSFRMAIWFCYWSLLACARWANYTQKHIVNEWVHKNYFVRSNDFYSYCNIFAFICSGSDLLVFVWGVERCRGTTTQNSLDAHIKCDITWRERGGDEDDDIQSNALICAHRE